MNSLRVVLALAALACPCPDVTGRNEPHPIALRRVQRDRQREHARNKGCR